MMQPVRVAVTGGTGFVGRAVCSALVGRGCDVVALTRTAGDRVAPDVEVVVGDLLEGSSVEELVRGADVVVHTAGLVRSCDVAALRRANVDGLVALLDRADEATRFVHLSTAGVHGLPGGSVVEDSPMRPGNAYEASKAAAETALFDRRPTGATAVRPTNILGVGHPLEPLVRFLRAVERGRVWAGPGACVNYVGLGTVADAVAAATLVPEPPRTLLVNDPRPLTDFAAAAATVLDVPDRTHVIPAVLATASRPLIGALARHVPPLHRARSLIETTRFESQHERWFDASGISRDVEPTLREMVADYRQRGLL